jgi:hypothetical protein
METRRNEGTEPETKRHGRPRHWSNEAEKHREYRVRRRERTALIDDLLHAVRNAHWADRAMQATVNYGDDLEVLRALIDYYRARYWMLPQRQVSEGSGREE